jgi:hypothetical protein
LSTSPGPIFHGDENWRNSITEIVAIGATVPPLDNSIGIRGKEFLGDDAMQVTDSETEAITLVTIPKDEARVRILSYVKSHVGCRTGDIIYDLGLDPDLVIECLKELESGGRIRGKTLGRD